MSTKCVNYKLEGGGESCSVLAISFNLHEILTKLPRSTAALLFHSHCWSHFPSVVSIPVDSTPSLSPASGRWAHSCLLGYCVLLFFLDPELPNSRTVHWHLQGTLITDWMLVDLIHEHSQQCARRGHVPCAGQEHGDPVQATRGLSLCKSPSFPSSPSLPTLHPSHASSVPSPASVCPIARLTPAPDFCLWVSGPISSRPLGRPFSDHRNLALTTLWSQGLEQHPGHSGFSINKKKFEGIRATPKCSL